MKKKLVVCIIIILFIIMGFVVYKFLDSIKKDQDLTKKKMEEMLDTYQVFSKNINSFASKREELYKRLDSTYLEDFAKNYNDWNTYIASYEEEIKKVDSDIGVLKKNCFMKFASVDVNSACTNFKANYEAAMNYYITDIKNYNKNVKKYNQWAKENNYGTLNKGKLVVYKKYIDFDKDGQYFGKDED